MKNKAFIPNWYIEKRNIIRNKRYKICSVLILITNIMLFSFILNISNKTKVVEESRRKSNDNIDIIQYSQESKENIIILDKFQHISKFFEENNLIYKNMTITKESLEIIMEAKNYEEYIEVIKSIENHYSIKKLTPIINNKENVSFEVILEV